MLSRNAVSPAFVSLLTERGIFGEGPVFYKHVAPTEQRVPLVFVFYNMSLLAELRMLGV